MIRLPGNGRVCIVLLTGLGDVIHGLPVASALKRARPDLRITWVVEPMPAPVVEEHPAVDDVVVFHKGRGARGVARLGRELAGRRFDLTLNFNIYFKSVFPTVLSRAPVRLGFDRGRSRDLTWLFANRRLPRRPRAHTQDMFLEFLEPLGVEPEPLAWRLGPTAREREAQRAFFRRFDRPVAAIVPASGNAKKDWLPERWAAVLDALDRDFGYATMLVGGPSQRERRVVEQILETAGARPAVAMGDGIRPLLWRVHGSDLVVAPDTGPVHMARAMGVPVVGLYGHTNPWRVGPYRKYQELWVDAYTEPDEPPDPSSFTPKLGRMERITVGDVLERVECAVERYPPRAAGRRDRYLGADPSGGGAS
ncbi:MAG: glycosyltransferase family 9 protein [Gemmatimonadota bacterium]